MTMYLDDEDSALLGPGELRPRPGLRRLDRRRRQRRVLGRPRQLPGLAAAARSGTGRATARRAPRCRSASRTRSSATPARGCRSSSTATTRPQVAPHSGPTHWWGGYASQSDTMLGLDTPVTGGETVVLLELALHRGGLGLRLRRGPGRRRVGDRPGRRWPATATVVSTNEDPHGGNTEGNGITGTSGGEYFVDEPQYVRVRGCAAGRCHRRAVALLHRRRLPRHRLVHRRRHRERCPARRLAADDGGSRPTGIQDNNWTRPGHLGVRPDAGHARPRAS